MIMKWFSIREVYPNQFIKLKSLSSKIINEQELIGDVALVEVLEDKNATKELLNSKGVEFVYHTAHEKN